MLMFGVLIVGVLSAGVPGGMAAAPPDPWAGEDPCVVVMDPARGVFAGVSWPGGVVPYEFDEGVTPLNQTRMLDAMAELEAAANVVYVPRSGHSNYLCINSAAGNSSPLGMVGGPQQLSVTSWDRRFIIAHELMHALGAIHEHQRADRDTYIEILWDEIDPGWWPQFDKLPNSVASKHGEYDFESIMHYKQCTFTNCAVLLSCTECRTIQMQPEYAEYQGVIGQKDYLSDGDAALLVFLYGLPGGVDDAFEDNDDAESAAAIGPGSYEMQLQDNEDYFTLGASGDGSLVIAAQSGEPLLDARLRVYTDVGGIVATRRMLGGAVAAFDLDVAPGAYTLCVERLTGHAPYQLTVGGTALCPADLDGSGSLNVDDIDAFVTLFFAGDLAVDLDANGALNVDDVEAFVAAFLGGCP
ncbi:MAG: hypothetical protein DHS20C14_01290 [Phycisphaeraceae bacterium]|nr:MAG: hypothetical protein DHS20C14_01290 [Phycisphaeraceae bacterium]